MADAAIMANVSVPPFTEAPSTVVGSTAQSVFPFEFPFWSTADILVYVDGVLLASSAYSVEGFYVQGDPPAVVEGGYGSGEVTLDTAVTNRTVTIDRMVAGDRETQFSKTSPLPMPALNGDLNRVTARQQDLARLVGTNRAYLDAAIAEAGDSLAMIGKASVAALAAVSLPVGTPSYTRYFDESTGSDTTGDGSEESKFATLQKAFDALPFLTGRVSMSIVGTGDVTTNYVSASSMTRAALLSTEGVKVGRRSDAPGASGMTGGLVIDLSGATLKPNATYPRGIYATGFPGRIGVVLNEIDAQTGAESGITAHCGSYVQVRGGTINGNGVTGFLGLLAEAGGLMETTDTTATGCTADAQVYGAGSFIQMAAPGAASPGAGASVGKVNISAGGEFGIANKMKVATSIVNRGLFSISSSTESARCVFSGDYDGQGGKVSGSYLSQDNAAASIVARGEHWKIDAFKFDGQLNLEGGAYILRGSTSYTTGTQSTHAIPVLYSPGTYLDNTSSTWKGSSGLSPVALDPTDRYQTVTVTANSQTISVKAVAGKRNFVVLSTTANRTGCKVDVTMYGDAASAPNTATELIFLNLSGFTVQLINSAPNNLLGIINSSIYIGNATGAYPSAGFVWQTTYGTGGGWYCVTPQVGRETGYTAKTGTALKGAIAAYAAGAAITAPTGGATQDAESRTAIGLLITRLATVEAALQNESQRAKAYEDTLRGHGFIN